MNRKDIIKDAEVLLYLAVEIGLAYLISYYSENHMVTPILSLIFVYYGKKIKTKLLP